MQNNWNIKILSTEHATNHVGITTLFIIQLLFLLHPQVVAQSGGGTSSSPPEDQYLSDNTLKVSPGMAILLVGLVTTFFMMGCVSVYARRCIDAWSGSTRGGGLPTRDNRRSGRNRHGLDPNVMDTFPVFLYSDVKSLKIGKVALECAVCLSEFEDDANLRLLPKCCHVFHAECIDTWLASHATCPVCRADLVPVPGEEAINTRNLERAESVSGSTHLIRSPEVQGQQVNEIGELMIDISTIGSTEVTNPAQSPVPNRKTIATPKSPPPVVCRFLRSHSTGHSLVQPGQDLERFTLRLPDGVQEMLKNPDLRRVASNAAFQTERSPKRWFRRSTSVGTGGGRNNDNNNNNVYYERFEREARPERWGFSITPPFVSRSKSSQSLATEGSNKINITSSGSVIKTAVKSPIERLFSVGAEKDDDAGERSFARLTGNNPV